MIRIPWWRTDLGRAESDRLSQAIFDRTINQGRLCRELEERIARQLEVNHVISCSSGSGALALGLMACGVKPGDEVIVPAATFIATAHAVLLVGGRVKLVDVMSDRPLIDPEAVSAAITPQTRAIVAVHLNGAGCDISALKRFGLPVIEDSAQAFCSKGKQGWLGTSGAIGTFSMSIAKLMTTGEGGFLVTGDEATAVAARRLQNQGVDVIGDNVFNRFGFNFRLTDLQAAVGLVQLDRLDDKIRAVTDVYRFYRDALPGLSLIPVDLQGGEVPLWTQAMSRDRDRLQVSLEERGIQLRPFNPCLADCDHLRTPGDFVNARRFAAEGFTLPSGPDQPRADLEEVANALREVMG